jgi:hypothetical protein
MIAHVFRAIDIFTRYDRTESDFVTQVFVVDEVLEIQRKFIVSHNKTGALTVTRRIRK